MQSDLSYFGFDKPNSNCDDASYSNDICNYFRYKRIVGYSIKNWLLHEEIFLLERLSSPNIVSPIGRQLSKSI